MISIATKYATYTDQNSEILATVMSIPSEESVYNLIPKDPPRPYKAPRHKSMFGQMVRVESKQNKVTNKTMGPAKVHINPPKSYLHKHSKEPKLPEKKPFQYPDHSTRRPPVPQHTDRPQMGATSSKNFVTINAVNNIMSVPCKPAPKYVDSVSGTRHELEASGLVPKYTNKKDYGKVPAYLEQHRREMAEAQEQYDHYVQESLRRGQMQQVAADKREELLTGLKKNWEVLHHQYQGLSVVTDTAPKKARKERMEAEMKQLERDIELIERHKYQGLSVVTDTALKKTLRMESEMKPLERDIEQNQEHLRHYVLPMELSRTG